MRLYRRETENEDQDATSRQSKGQRNEDIAGIVRLQLLVLAAGGIV